MSRVEVVAGGKRVLLNGVDVEKYLDELETKVAELEVERERLEVEVAELETEIKDLCQTLADQGDNA